MRDRHQSIEVFRRDHQDALYIADRIKEARGSFLQRGRLEAGIREALDFVSGPMRRHLREERQTLIAVLHEHLADQAPDILTADERRRERVEEDLQRIRMVLERGRGARGALKEMEMCLRDYVQYEEDVLLPWVDANLGDVLMREVDARYAAMHRPQMTLRERPIDIDALMEEPLEAKPVPADI